MQAPSVTPMGERLNSLPIQSCAIFHAHLLFANPIILCPLDELHGGSIFRITTSSVLTQMAYSGQEICTGQRKTQISIRLTVNWIENVLVTERYIKNMPDPEK